jgi:hypothetical protein
MNLILPFVFACLALIGCSKDSSDAPRAGATRIIDNGDGTYTAQFYRTDPHWYGTVRYGTLKEAQALQWQFDHPWEERPVVEVGATTAQENCVKGE